MNKQKKGPYEEIFYLFLYNEFVLYQLGHSISVRRESGRLVMAEAVPYQQIYIWDVSGNIRTFISIEKYTTNGEVHDTTILY